MQPNSVWSFFWGCLKIGEPPTRASVSFWFLIKPPSTQSQTHPMDESQEAMRGSSQRPEGRTLRNVNQKLQPSKAFRGLGSFRGAESRGSFAAEAEAFFHRGICFRRARKPRASQVWTKPKFSGLRFSKEVPQIWCRLWLPESEFRIFDVLRWAFCRLRWQKRVGVALAISPPCCKGAFVKSRGSSPLRMSNGGTPKAL